MGETVTRQFCDSSTGAPIVGAQFRLVSSTDVSQSTIPLTEIVTTVEADQGRYTTGSTPVPHGVYKVQIYQSSAYVDFIDASGSVAEITVSPGRSNFLGVPGSLVDVVINNVVQACSFVVDSSAHERRTAGSGINLQTCLNWAETNGYKKVYVGVFRGESVWFSTTDSIHIPNGMEVDLGGATIQNGSWTSPVLILDGSAVVRNGTLQGTASGSTGYSIVKSSDTTSMAIFDNVKFAGSPGSTPTVATDSGAESPALFIGCTGVILRDPALISSAKPRLRKQISIGATSSLTNQSGETVTELAGANVTGQELGDLVRGLLEKASIGPLSSDSTPVMKTPFASSSEVADAIKSGWFTKPVYLFMGKHGSANPQGDIEDEFITIDIGGGTVASVKKDVFERKVQVIGNGICRRILMNFALSFRFIMNDAGGDDGHASLIWHLHVSDIAAALSAIPAFANAPSLFIKQEDGMRKFSGSEEFVLPASGGTLLYPAPRLAEFYDLEAFCWNENPPSGWGNPSIFTGLHGDVWGASSDVSWKAGKSNFNVSVPEDNLIDVKTDLVIDGAFKNRPMWGMWGLKIDMPYPEVKHRVINVGSVTDDAFRNAGFGTTTGLAFMKVAIS